MTVKFGPWAGHKYFLDKMNLGDLVVAYLTHYAIMSYLVLSVPALWFAVTRVTDVWASLAAAALVLPVYPLVWYLLHRFVLHGNYLYKSPLTAAVWKRIHYDHHQDPNDLSVLFGALYTTLPTIVLITGPIGWAIGGAPAAAAAIASGLLTTCFYEFCHCVQHLPFKPRWKALQRMKRVHIAHHFHNENGNYGITNFFWDRLLSTYYDHPKLIARSATVFNLGYTEAQAGRYPWVARMSSETQRPGATKPGRG